MRLMRVKSVVMDDKTMKRTLLRMSHEIIERYRGVENVALIGIRRRGVPLARTIAQIICKVEGTQIPVGELDITHYRDDLSTVCPMPRIQATDVPFEVTDKRIVLVDDVIYTGRTCRAAIDAVFALGRPASIALAVMVDRGHRELPIKPDFVGKNIPTSKSEVVSVRLREFDGETNISILEKDL
jgi:pyrimidine operon attenuation protein/uracil phosphoribosyltransferase